MTLHQDVVPTIMQSILGCRNPPNDYANGINLFKLPEKRCSVLASYFSKGYLIDDHIVENLSGKTYSWFDMNSPNPKIDLRQVKLVMQEERMFLK
jgi:membrane-anchored protein YejM (alkaline phosphatase superfamily)